MKTATEEQHPATMALLEQDVDVLRSLKGRRAEALANAGVRTVRDLLHYYPRRYLDRSTITPIRMLHENMSAATVLGTVCVASMERGRTGERFGVLLEDRTGDRLKCVWFKGTRWVRRAFSKGDRVAVHGKPQRYGALFSMAHPEFDKLDAIEPALDTGRIIPLYPGSAALNGVGLNSRSFRRIIYDLFRERGMEMPEILPIDLREGLGLLDGRVSLRGIHFPKSNDELALARRRLKFEEFFFMQLMLALTHRNHTVRREGPRLVGPGPHVKRFLEEGLPFELTGAQRSALRDVFADTSSGNRMNRLVQGDVGSGKTVVAVTALLHAIDNGYQGAFMAPTEILAEQHYANLLKYLDPLGVEMRLLTGGQRKTLRQAIIADLANGQARVAVGTHALIQEGVVFNRLGLTIIDEQHRFGVMQRARIFEKGELPHMLLMTATPIPRSLAMTLYGDLDVSVMKELPPGRQPVRTWLRYEKDRKDVYAFVRRQIERGRQCYVVYPLVEESEKIDLKDAESGYEALSDTFAPHAVDLIHGRMASDEKDAAMGRFHQGETKVLVATTVIEVGVDVANATVMLIEHAERFGISQLHQLRGRVGRGSKQSYCILMADYRRTQEARDRLRAMIGTNDGFKISEIDLNLRGYGDFFGTKQSGLPDMKIAALPADEDILTLARQAAFGPDPSGSRPGATRARRAPELLQRLLREAGDEAGAGRLRREGPPLCPPVVVAARRHSGTEEHGSPYISFRATCCRRAVTVR